ncbi:hypothetical protein ACS0TY_022402 [Phlomoides rotata]
MGFLEALSWVKSLQLEKVIFEGDANIVVYAINSNSTGKSVFFDLVSSCRSFLDNSCYFSFQFVRRDADKSGFCALFKCYMWL